MPCLEARPNLKQYGRSLGICFQLVDDLLDFTASESDLGKPVLCDLKEGRLTLPLILLLPRIDAGGRRRIETVLEEGEFKSVAAEEILEMVEAEGTVGEVREMAERLRRRGSRCPSLLPRRRGAGTLSRSRQNLSSAGVRSRAGSRPKTPRTVGASSAAAGKTRAAATSRVDTTVT